MGTGLGVAHGAGICSNHAAKRATASAVLSMILAEEQPNPAQIAPFGTHATYESE